MGIIEFMILLFLICAVIAVINIVFGPFNIPPKLIQIASIIGFVILVLIILSYFGYLPGNLRIK